LTAAALGLAAGIDLVSAGVAGLVLLALWSYDRRLKAMSGLGNGLVALLAGCAPLTGAVAANGLAPAGWVGLLPTAVTLACFVAAREVLKTVEDVAGDRLMRKRTLAVRWGIDAALRVYVVLAAAAIASSWLPFLVQGYAAAYLVLMTIGVHIPLVRPLLARHEITPARAHDWLRWLKVSYLMGIVALLLA
jgi:4-hydroxybenzoate polyprenyltransferase